MAEAIKEVVVRMISDLFYQQELDPSLASATWIL